MLIIFPFPTFLTVADYKGKKSLKYNKTIAFRDEQVIVERPKINVFFGKIFFCVSFSVRLICHLPFILRLQVLEK